MEPSADSGAPGTRRPPSPHPTGRKFCDQPDPPLPPHAAAPSLGGHAPPASAASTSATLRGAAARGSAPVAVIRTSSSSRTPPSP